jgi:two-component system response regulator RegX3
VSRVLIVDDEPALVDSVAYALRKEGFEVDCVADGEGALAAVEQASFDLVLLDLNLPSLSGIEVCRRLRAESAVPIIMLTARDSELDRVLGLEVGADDYVAKPFSMAELVGKRHLVGGLEIDLLRHQAAVDGKEIQLTPSEFKLLAYLAEDPDRVYSRRELMQLLWGSSFVGDERACDAHVANLRRKIEREPAVPERLLSVRGIGYKLVAV